MFAHLFSSLAGFAHVNLSRDGSARKASIQFSRKLALAAIAVEDK
jgi:hypothetical protein